ncbi:hypothetical protein GIB67_002261 [Kingdonia uniflora]|uniref:Zinc finger PMZ-type domain-containing protein n=1 Tax=Kingdonia uniflora TaxID=39325 RepID=A0A7J7KWW4_9MAGN|nr:hypothetical protein GIB67_002261 [Kingdonia uniflora]
MKKYHRGTHLEKLIWGAAKAWKQTEKKEFLDLLKLDDPTTYDWLRREPYERWCRSHFDFSTKCEHITNNFSESFNNWINKVRDKPLHRAIEKLNLMLMKLMYDRRLKAREWDQNGLVPRAVTHIEKMSKKWSIQGRGEWQLTGLPCVHAVSVLIPMRHHWIDEYHTVAKYVATYNLPIHAIDDPSKWGQVLLPNQVELLQDKGIGLTQIVAELNIEEMLVPPPPQTPIMRGRGRGNSARGGRGSANSNNESGTSTNTGRGNGKKIGRATAIRGRGTAAKTGNNATANTGRGAASNIGRGATSNILEGCSFK